MAGTTSGNRHAIANPAPSDKALADLVCALGRIEAAKVLGVHQRKFDAWITQARKRNPRWGQTNVRAESMAQEIRKRDNKDAKKLVDMLAELRLDAFTCIQRILKMEVHDPAVAIEQARFARQFLPDVDPGSELTVSATASLRQVIRKAAASAAPRAIDVESTS